MENRYLMKRWFYNAEKGDSSTKKREYVLFHPSKPIACFGKDIESLVRNCIEYKMLNENKFEVSSDDQVVVFGHGWDSQFEPVPYGRIKEFLKRYGELRNTNTF